MRKMNCDGNPFRHRASLSQIVLGVKQVIMPSIFWGTVDWAFGVPE